MGGEKIPGEKCGWPTPVTIVCESRESIPFSSPIRDRIMAKNQAHFMPLHNPQATTVLRMPITNNISAMKIPINPMKCAIEGIIPVIMLSIAVKNTPTAIRKTPTIPYNIAKIVTPKGLSIIFCALVSDIYDIVVLTHL